MRICFLAGNFLALVGHQNYLLRSFSTVHCFVSVIAGKEDAFQLVNTHRSITMGSVLRRRPNAFNLLHQQQLLERVGEKDSMKAGQLVLKPVIWALRLYV